MVIHIRASISLDRPYGPEQARAFLEQLLPLATNITVQLAHMGGSGPGFNDPKADAFMDALVEKLYGDGGGRSSSQNRKSKMRDRVWFDLTSTAHPTNSPERSALLAKRIRQIGVNRILYGTDAAVASNLRPRDAWAEVWKLGLSKKELKTIANNRAPYLR